MSKLHNDFKPKFLQMVWVIGEDGMPYKTMFSNAKTTRIAFEAGNVFETREDALKYKLVAVLKEDKDGY